jgi:hypothetical protein
MKRCNKYRKEKQHGQQATISLTTQYYILLHYNEQVESRTYRIDIINFEALLLLLLLSSSSTSTLNINNVFELKS